MTEANKIRQKNLPPQGRGRPKGIPNKTTTLLKDALLIAAEEAGGQAGLVGYLKVQAIENPGPFMALLGKVLPMQVTGADGGPMTIRIVKEYVSPRNGD